MSLTSRLGLFALAVGVCLALYEWQLVKQSPRELTQASLRLFDNSNAAAEELRVADASRHWLAALAVCLFGEDAARAWRERRGSSPPSS